MIKFKEILFLNNLKRVGKSAIYGKYWKILNECADLDDLISKVQSVDSKFSSQYLHETKEKVDEQYHNIINSDIKVITIFDENYPKQLELLEKKKPLFLFIRGNADALFEPNIAVIGTRKPLKMSEKFEKEAIKCILNDSDRVIISGLALGCDKIAHKTTVDENRTTIAILPSGVNVITPVSNKKLAEEILANGGCLVSEYLPDAKAYKRTYVERDKIVAAFSDATFVVECGVKSGTMHTVNAAFDYGKTIFSYLPENKIDGTYDGNEFILKNNKNAIKVENCHDFLNDLENLENHSNDSEKLKTSQQTLI